MDISTGLCFRWGPAHTERAAGGSRGRSAASETVEISNDSLGHANAGAATAARLPVSVVASLME